MKIEKLEAVIVDLPTIREHRLANSVVTTQALVIVRILTDEGLDGIGEATTIGGLSYGDESPEGIKVALDTYIAPLLIGRDPGNVGAVMADISRRVRGNRVAKSAVETALLDITAKSLGVPIVDLFGGVQSPRIELAWTLASGDTGKDIEEAEKVIGEKRHRIFKLKIGAGDPKRDVAHTVAIKKALGDRGSVRVDINQAWDELTAVYGIAALEDAGVDLIEQPVDKDNHQAMRRLSERFMVPIMADEAVATPRDAFELARIHAADVYALKIAKAGGLHGTRAVAAIAQAAGISLYGGTMLEGSVGSLASLHVFASLPRLEFGCELFAPLLLKDDIVTERPVFRDFAIELPDRPGLGTSIDTDKLRHYARKI